jgi:hypothetical protein
MITLQTRQTEIQSSIASILHALRRLAGFLNQATPQGRPAELSDRIRFDIGDVDIRPQAERHPSSDGRSLERSLLRSI